MVQYNNIRIQNTNTETIVVWKEQQTISYQSINPIDHQSINQSIDNKNLLNTLSSLRTCY